MPKLKLRVTFKVLPRLTSARKRRILELAEDLSRQLNEAAARATPGTSVSDSHGICTCVSFGGCDLLDVTPEAHKIVDRLLKNCSAEQREKVKRSRIRWFAEIALKCARFPSQKSRIEKLIESLDLLSFRSLAKSYAGRRAIAFVHSWKNLDSRAQKNALLWTLAPAFDTDDWESIKHLASAMQFKKLQCTHVDQTHRLIEDAILGKTTPMVPREIRKEYFPNAQMDMRNLRRWLDRWGIPHREDPRRGAASPFYSKRGTKKKQIGSI